MNGEIYVRGCGLFLDVRYKTGVVPAIEPASLRVFIPNTEWALTGTITLFWKARHGFQGGGVLVSPGSGFPLTQ